MTEPENRILRFTELGKRRIPDARLRLAPESADQPLLAERGPLGIHLFRHPQHKTKNELIKETGQLRRKMYATIEEIGLTMRGSAFRLESGFPDAKIESVIAEVNFLPELDAAAHVHMRDDGRIAQSITLLTIWQKELGKTGTRGREIALKLGELIQDAQQFLKLKHESGIYDGGQLKPHR